MRKDMNESEEIEFYRYAESLVNCDLETGVVTWKPREVTGRLSKTWNTMYAGKVCGSVSKDGYRTTCVTYNSKLLSVQVHKLLWFIAYNKLPECQIDHINQVRTDNRISNLREVTSAENNQNRRITSNNASGVVGVSWNKEKRRWVARVTFNGEVFRVGSYKDIGDAEIAVKAFRKEKGFTDLHGT